MAQNDGHTPASRNAVELRGISKAYGAAWALRSVDLTVGWGRILALFGHNGAGKSTLLRVLTTLVSPDEGSAHVAGFGTRTQPKLARASVGYAGHQDLLYGDLTPVENLRFYARLHRIPNAGERVREVIGDVGATGWAERRTRTLSNGMQKRVAIARALLHRPPLLLLDEPDAGLDAEARELVDAVVRAVAHGGGTVVLTSHDAARGLAVADEYAVLRSGRLIAAGAAADARASDVAACLGGRTGAA